MGTESIGVSVVSRKRQLFLVGGSKQQLATFRFREPVSLMHTVFTKRLVAYSLLCQLHLDTINFSLSQQACILTVCCNSRVVTHEYHNWYMI